MEALCAHKTQSTPSPRTSPLYPTQSDKTRHAKAHPPSSILHLIPSPTKRRRKTKPKFLVPNAPSRMRRKTNPKTHRANAKQTHRSPSSSIHPPRLPPVPQYLPDTLLQKVTNCYNF